MERPTALKLLSDLHRAQNAFYAGGSNTELQAILSPEISWTVPGRNAIAGLYTGLDEVLSYFARRRDIANQTLQMRCTDVLVGDGPEIAALTDGTAVLRGCKRQWSTVGLYSMRDSRIVRCWLLPLNPLEFDHIWSGG